MRLRTIFLEHLSKKIKKSIVRLLNQSEETIKLMSLNEPDGRREAEIRNSPLYIMLMDMYNNNISYSRTMRKIRREFPTMIQTAMQKRPEVNYAMMTPIMRAMLETPYQSIEGTVNSTSMELDEIRDEFKGLRQEGDSIIRTIEGQYILTENDYMQYRVNFPVIQIERMLTGSRIVNVNAAASALGFQRNLFIESIEERDADIDEFLQSGSSGARPKQTLFKMKRLGEQFRDREVIDEDMERKVVEDDIDMLGDDFFEEIM